jgi:hypothetical protein
MIVVVVQDLVLVELRMMNVHSYLLVLAYLSRTRNSM